MTNFVANKKEIMNIRLIAISLAATFAAASADACTSLIATPGATADSSAMITYAADSHTLYGELYHTPGSTHAAGEMRKIYDWDSGRYCGEIPQAPVTYTTMGNMNEHGVTIAESTWGGRPELKGSGLIDYGSLIYIALERSATAREALGVMTSLVRDYGYASDGESFSIADAGEVWIMEMIGKGKADPGAVWVARRVPDGMISGHANHSRIHTFPLDDPETLYSPDVIEFARSQGYFDGRDEDFDFSRAYAIADALALRGCDARVWAYYNRFSEPGAADRWLPWILKGEGEVLPLWIAPSRKLTANDLKWMMRDHFEGTPLDMTKDPGAGPFDVPYRWRPLTYKVGDATYTHERAIATQQTGFSFVSSMNAARPAAMRGILWFGVDDANTCVYIPVFNSLTEVPRQLAHGNGDMLTLSWDAMFWVTNYVANQAYNRYSQMIPDIRRVQRGFESRYEAEADSLATVLAGVPDTEAAAALTACTMQAAADVTAGYKALGDFLLVKFLDGNIKKQDEDGTFSRTPEGMPDSPQYGGYNQRFFEQIVTSEGDRLRIE